MDNRIFTIWKICLVLTIIGFTGNIGYGQENIEQLTNQTIFEQVRWSPYIVGAGIGILTWLTFFFSNKAIGVSGAFARTAGMIEKLFRGKAVEDRAYYKKNPPKINWEWLFVLGLIIGSYTSAKLSGDFEIVWVPGRWLESAGDSRWLRWIFAFIGGTAMGFGARWARGCTSGHGISGTLQLAVSSWIATIALFASGVATALILFNVVLG